MHLIAIGGSDAGISAALRARELDPSVEVTVVVASPGSASGADAGVIPSLDAFARQEDTRSIGPEERTMPTDENFGDETSAPPVDVEAEIVRLQETGLKDKEVAKEIARLTGRSARDIYADLVRKRD